MPNTFDHLVNYDPPIDDLAVPFTPDGDEPRRCAVCDNEPAEEGDEHNRCERCAYEDLRPCRDSECNGWTARPDGYCYPCAKDRDDCAREDAADAARDDR